MKLNSTFLIQFALFAATCTAHAAEVIGDDGQGTAVSNTSRDLPSCTKKCDDMITSRRACLRGCKKKPTKNKKRRCRQSCKPRKAAIKNCRQACKNASSQKPKDDCTGLDTEYNELKCKILETFDEDECQHSGISGLWPSDEDSQICQIAASFTTDCESGRSSKRRVHLLGEGSVEDDCDTIESPESVSSELKIKTNLQKWKLHADVNLKGTSTCSLKADGVKCSSCRVCSSANGKFIGLKASCNNNGPTSVAFSEGKCVGITKLIGG